MNILVGTDGRSHSENATDYSMILSKAFEANLFIIYVVDKNGGEDKEKRIKNGMRVLGRLKIKAAESGVEVKTLLEAGRPQETILEAAERIGADMIVIGSPGGSGAGLMKKKGLQQSIMNNATCTVILVK